MQIKEMFKKSITRDIQGVVIAGQGEKNNIVTELEEYVVTPELQRHFADSFLHMPKEFMVRPQRWESGSPAFLEVVNLTC